MDFTDVLLESIESSQKFGGDIYKSLTPGRVEDFSSCNNILKTPKYITKAIKKADCTVKPDLRYKKASDTLALKHGVKSENVVVEKNSFSLLDVILKSLKARSATVVMPCEPFCKDICRVNNCDVNAYVLKEEKGFEFDCDDFIDSIPSRTDALIISNPNNATGRAVSRGEMKNLLDYCLTKGIYVIVDETYMDFVPDGQSVAGMISDYYNLVVMRSLSEYYNIAGVGVAYCLSCEDIAENIRIHQLPWCVDVFGALVCENAVEDEKFALKTKKWIFDEKKKFVKKINALGSIKIIHSDCHFLLLKLEDTSAITVYNRLLKSNILIRDASSFTGLDGSYIRVAVKDEKSNSLFLENILKCLI